MPRVRKRDSPSLFPAIASNGSRARRFWPPSRGLAHVELRWVILGIAVVAFVYALFT